MTRPTLLEALKSRVLLGDGAMGTQLQDAGLESGHCGEAWNLDHPDRVVGIQRRYAEAGSDLILTNTFGACRIMLDRHGEGARTADINRASVAIAREALGGRGYVLGDIGPFGGLMEPYGDISRAAVERAFREQARALVEGGADGIIIETQTAFEEVEIAIAAAREAGAPVVIASFAFDRMLDEDDVRTMMGISPEQAAEFMERHGCDVAGLNCGTGVDMRFAADITRRYRATCGLPVMAQPNAGAPVLEDMKVLYKQTPGEMGDGLEGLLAAGPRIVGGCCGSTPAHIRMFREILDGKSGEQRA
ncbi:MAG: homocysteine S-methyltransferase family protein [Steroidobacteraceae bacterium]|nr:homocysteine S-methyltransferase family protein [Steroidobacteraceae bacterium]